MIDGGGRRVICQKTKRTSSRRGEHRTAPDTSTDPERDFSLAVTREKTYVYRHSEAVQVDLCFACPLLYPEPLRWKPFPDLHVLGSTADGEPARILIRRKERTVASLEHIHDTSGQSAPRAVCGVLGITNPSFPRAQRLLYRDVRADGRRTGKILARRNELVPATKKSAASSLGEKTRLGSVTAPSRLVYPAARKV